MGTDTDHLAARSQNRRAYGGSGFGARLAGASLVWWSAAVPARVVTQKNLKALEQKRKKVADLCRNCIKMALTELETYLRRIGARSITNTFNTIAEFCELYSPEECWNYFAAAG